MPNAVLSALWVVARTGGCSCVLRWGRKYQVMSLVFVRGFKSPRVDFGEEGARKHQGAQCRGTSLKERGAEEKRGVTFFFGAPGKARGFSVPSEPFALCFACSCSRALRRKATKRMHREECPRRAPTPPLARFSPASCWELRQCQLDQTNHALHTVCHA